MQMPLLQKTQTNNAIRAIMNAAPEINFGGGWGNRRAPEKLRQCFEDVVRSDFHSASRYSKTKGNERFLEVLVDRLEEGVYGRRGIALKNIISGNGSTELASCLFKILLQPEDTVLLSDPCYLNYPTQASVEGKGIRIRRFRVLDEQLNFLPLKNKGEFIEEFEHEIKATKPKIVLIATPDNPTGQTWPSGVVERMCKAALNAGVWFIMDMSYRSIYFGEKPTYYSLDFNDYENLITLHSFSKDFSLLGLRAAYAVAREDVIEQLEYIEGTRSLSPITLVQLSLLRFFNASTPEEIDGCFQENRRDYFRACQVMAGSLKEKIRNALFLAPSGGFYLILKIGGWGVESDAEFAAKLYEEQRVAVVPGSAFGKATNLSLRLSYAPLVDQLGRIEEGIGRLARKLSGGGKNHGRP